MTTGMKIRRLVLAAGALVGGCLLSLAAATQIPALPGEWERRAGRCPAPVSDLVDHVRGHGHVLVTVGVLLSATVAVVILAWPEDD